MTNETLQDPLTVSLQPNDILLVTIRGNLTEENLPLLRDNIGKATDFIKQESIRAGRKLPVIVDLVNLDRVYSPEAITLLATLEKNDDPYVTKTVCYGADIQVKFAGEIVTALSGRKNVSFVDSKEDALAAIESDTKSPA